LKSLCFLFFLNFGNSELQNQDLIELRAKFFSYEEKTFAKKRLKPEGTPWFAFNMNAES